MMRRIRMALGLGIALAVMLAAPAGAQSLDFDLTDDRVPEGERTLVRLSFTPGVRTVSVSGNRNVFRTHLDLGEGLNLFDVGLVARREAGGWFDELRFDMSGFQGDPNDSLDLVLRRAGSYRLDLTYDRDAGIFAYPELARGWHPSGAGRRHYGGDLSVTPGWGRIRVGFDRRDLDGPAGASQSFSRDEFRLDEEVDSWETGWNVGVDVPIGAVDLTLEYASLDRTHRDRQSLTPGGTQGFDKTPFSTALFQFRRSMPHTSDSETAQASLRWKAAEDLSVWGRATRASSRTEVHADESLVGLDVLGAFTIRDRSWSGRAKSPNDLVEAGLEWRIRRGLTLTADVSRRDLEVNSETKTNQTLIVGGPPTAFSFFRSGDLRVESLDASASVEADLGSDLALTAGAAWRGRETVYDRVGRAASLVHESDRISAFAAVDWRPARHLTLSGEVELVSEDEPLVRTTGEDQLRAKLRARWKPVNGLRITAAAERKDADYAAGAGERDLMVYTLELGYDHEDWLNVSAGWNRVDLTSEIAIAFPVFFAPAEGVSLYEIDQDNVWIGLEGRWGSRVRGRLLFQRSTDDGSFDAKYERVEPQVFVHVARAAWVSAGYFAIEYEEPGAADLGYRARGAVAALTLLF